tara:strand:+ start:384 stop:2048 length:1665 start_codon:yes stop_codon:yes gene_type:complete
LGTFVHDDYGISWEEDSHRLNGQINIRYIEKFIDEFSISKFLNNELPSLDAVRWTEVDRMFDDPPNSKHYGSIFDVSVEYINGLIQFSDVKDFFIFKHFVNFCVFFIASIFFFDLVSTRFGDWRIGLFGSLVLILSPRIFANSFYNMKDLIFMSLFIIAMNTGSKYLINPNLKNIFLFSITSALLVDIRSIGILLPTLIIFLTALQYFHKSISFRNLFTNTSLLIFLISLFTIIFWPRLWEAPYSNFVSSLVYYMNQTTILKNFYLGEYVGTNDLPWHYLSIWIIITTPTLYVILFFFGFFFMLKRFLKRLKKIDVSKKNYNNLWKGKKELLDLFFLGLFLGPFLSIVIADSRLSDAWRHAYFLYPPLLMIAIYGFYQLNIILNKKKIKKYFLFIILLFPLSTFFWMIKEHPFQNVYFNYLASKNPDKYFELDYLGLSNREILERLLKKDPKDIIKIWISSHTPLHTTINYMIDKKNRARIKTVKNIEESDYILNNNRYIGGENSMLDFVTVIEDGNRMIRTKFNSVKNQFEVFEQIKVGNIVINTLYKNNKIY